MGKYKILLPKTSFSMKGNLREKEPKMQKFWQDLKIYEKILEKNSPKPQFILHDGPPYANGHIHIGHALNKILKDILVKFKNISGWKAPFVPGWDCHGLPIEYQLFRQLKVKKSEISQIEFRKKAEEFVKKFLNIQAREFMRLGVFADWKNPYLTMDKKYEAGILEAFAKLVEKGLVYRGEKPIYWCPICETALAEAEVEYKDASAPSIYVLFKSQEEENTYAVVWTTTPWTLPANVAIAFNENFLYSTISAEIGGEKKNLIIVDEKVAEVAEKAGFAQQKIVSQKKGIKFVGQKFLHPFLERTSVAIPAEFVEKKEGTGIVHIAPGHGEDDFRAGLKHNLPLYSPVDEKGRFTKESPVYEGEFVFDADEKIIELLKKKKTLLKAETITHSYPHCWRCKNPIIFRATSQWFISVDRENLRGKMLEEIKKTEWIPAEGSSRISAMVEQRPDWCISRQRYWGVPIPAFYCENCGKPLLDSSLIMKLAAIVSVEGSDVLLREKLPIELRCPACGGDKFRRETDILDVWFDSGSSFQILKKRANHSFPADIYLEGSDQHRGWFQTSLIISTATEGCAPYRTVLTHGFAVDGKGQKMSKSLGNVITPQEIIEKSGAEILRIWTASQNYSGDLRISEEILSFCVDSYRKIRNTFRFLLGNLHGWNPRMSVDFKDMKEVDRYILIRMEEVKKQIKSDYESYNFSGVFHKFFDFLNLDLSSFYLDILKDRLYTYGENWTERRSAQTVLWHLLKNLAILISPVLSHTAEETWQTARQEIAPLEESVFLKDIPKEEFFEGKTFKEKWGKIITLRNVILKALEKAREAGDIGNSLEAGISIDADTDTKAAISGFSHEDLQEIFLVSEIRQTEETGILTSFEETGIAIKVFPASGEKCERCWRYSQTVVEGLCQRCRKVLGIS
ncbi:MAG: isoleucine--tRNA ligase [Elusimicrobia bacterium]|nr:isoleucine--tRNA ligase [Elusimicrobiota bacterium]